MRLASVKPEDVVRCDRRGRRFWAQVTGREGPVLTLTPLSPVITYYRATAREVIEHYARRTLTNGRVSARAIRPEDLIAYSQDGQPVLAIVLTRTRARLHVLPVGLRTSPRDVHVRDVDGHYARRGRHRSADKAYERQSPDHQAVRKLHG